MTKHALLLDADFLVFSAMSAAEREIRWDDNVWTLECDHNKAWEIFLNSIETIKARRKAWADSKLVMCFTDTVNWRKDVLPTYKMNRKGTRKPTGYLHFVEQVMSDDRWVSFLRPTLEGDDCMGILSTRPQLVGCESATIVSPDKDFKTIPGEFFHMSADKILQISEKDADRYHMYQTLIGDTTDGYNGIRGVGAVEAEAFLNEPYKWVQVEKVLKSGKRKGDTVTEWSKQPLAEGETLWDGIVSLGAKAGMTSDEVLAQARVARICRFSDFDFKTKEVILWKP